MNTVCEEVRRILVVGPAWVGDAVLAHSLYQSLKCRHAEVEIDVVAPAWSKALLHRMPEVSQAIEMPAAHGELRLGARYTLGKQLRSRAYHQAIVLPRSVKAALLPWFAQVPIRTGFRGELRYGLINDMRPLDEAALPKIVSRFVFLGEPAGASPHAVEPPAPSLTVDAGSRDACLARLNLKKDTPVLALMPGAAFGRSKQWPAEHFAEVVRRYVGGSWQVWIFGSLGDRAFAEQIIRHSGGASGVVNLCAQTSLGEVIDLLSLAELAISNDSGLMHVAAAVGCPLVAVYGATSPSYTPPLIARSKCLWRGIECSPCWSKTCRYGHYRCLTEISPDEVWQAAEGL